MWINVNIVRVDLNKVDVLAISVKLHAVLDRQHQCHWRSPGALGCRIVLMRKSRLESSHDASRMIDDHVLDGVMVV